MNRDNRVSSYKSRPESSRPPGPSCVICFKSQTIFSVGACDHPVCYECSTTMRVLCDQKECPICRRIMTKVIFTKEVDLFKNLDSHQYSRYNKKYGIAFDDHSVEHSFEQLMRCYCKKCYDRPDFAVFEQLSVHMERNHRLYACRLCVKHLKIFPSQRRWYNYDELARHEECGDPDNTSHRGHPECHFCNVRYLDKDELYKHLRKEHFYCHFCDADGIQDYYMTYEWLRKHYYDKHYLCEEGNCVNEQFTSVFRTSIDLQAHKAQTHSRELGKHGSKEARTLKIEFNLRPRKNPIVEAGRPCQYQPPPDHSTYNTTDRTINVRNTLDFPSLNGQHTTVLPCARTRKQNQPVNTRDLNLFPALSQEPVPQPKPSTSANNVRMAAIVKKHPEPPKPDKNRDVAGPSSSRLPNQAKDFPSLDGNQTRVKEVPAATSNSGSWVSKAKTANESGNGQDEKKKVKKEAAIKKKIAEPPKVPSSSDFPNLNKKLEPSKSNLAKLGSKKKTDNSKKNSPSENSNNINNQNAAAKKTTSQLLAENNCRKAAVDNVKSTENNSKQKPKAPEALQVNGVSKTKNGRPETNGGDVKPKMSAKLETNKGEQAKKELSSKKNKENTTPVQSGKPEETDINGGGNPKEKKKRKKNENNNREMVVASTNLLEHQDNSKPNAPKIPPGFENSFQYQMTSRAPPGLAGNRSAPSTIKAPPGLSLTSQQKPLEYIHPPNSTVRNKVLINNLVAALIPARDDRFDTFEKFKEMSTLFRKHLITAFDFYSYCVEALCPHSFESVFVELVLLLPDIQKQQELLFIYNRNSGEEMNIEVCKYCRQVLRANDIDHHFSIHNTRS